MNDSHDPIGDARNHGRNAGGLRGCAVPLALGRAFMARRAPVLVRRALGSRLLGVEHPEQSGRGGFLDPRAAAPASHARRRPSRHD